ncbi:MAG: YpsA SLOG family protein [Candidatus Bathyanammoxibius sp.]
MIEKIISGGQTGADQGGLMAGSILGLPTGGTAPPRFWTESGADYSLRVYGLVAGDPDPKTYPLRTLANIQGSDGTLLIGNMESAGSRMTMRLCTQQGKPYIVNPMAISLRDWVGSEWVKTLNVAGNRESVNPGIRDRVICLLIDAFAGYVR